MKRLLLLLTLIATAAFGQTGSSSQPCIWSGAFADCLPSSGLSLKDQREARFFESTVNGTATVDVKAPADLNDASVVLTWPDAYDAGTDVIMTLTSSGSVNNKVFTAGNTYTMIDSSMVWENAGTLTKKVQLDLSNISAATTRVVQFPNAATQQLLGDSASQVVTNKTINCTNNTCSNFPATSLSGLVPLANGGTNKNMTAAAGGVVWTDSDSQEVTAAGTSAQILQSSGTTAPVWSTVSGDITLGATGVAAISSGVIVNGDVNASAAIAYSKLNLTGSIVNADVASAAAINYSKLALGGSIVNADVSGSAAIDGSKLQAAGSGNAGAVTTGTQTFAGIKTFSSTPVITGSGLAFNQGSLTFNSGGAGVTGDAICQSFTALAACVSCRNSSTGATIACGAGVASKQCLCIY
jgi:hypothetical protein